MLVWAIRVLRGVKLSITGTLGEAPTAKIKCPVEHITVCAWAHDLESAIGRKYSNTAGLDSRANVRNDANFVSFYT